MGEIPHPETSKEKLRPGLHPLTAKDLCAKDDKMGKWAKTDILIARRAEGENFQARTRKGGIEQTL